MIRASLSFWECHLRQYVQTGLRTYTLRVALHFVINIRTVLSVEYIMKGNLRWNY